MPELPEVETVKEELSTNVTGSEILKVRVLSDWAMVPRLFAEDLVGQKVSRILRHGKYLFLDIGEKYMVSHLGMSGSYRVSSRATKEKHDHFQIKAGDKVVTYNDPRRFGRLYLLNRDLLPELESPLKQLSGIEWFDLGPDALNQILVKGDSEAARRIWATRLRMISPDTEIKNALLNQTIIAGIGNIYASEILFYSHIHPQEKIKNLSQYAMASLAVNSSKVLRWALKKGGTSFPGSNKFKNTTGHEGMAFDELAVYGRDKKECRACNKTIHSFKQMGRTTFYCKKCQPKIGG